MGTEAAVSVGDGLSPVSTGSHGRGSTGGFGLSGTRTQVVWLSDLPDVTPGEQFRFCHYNQIALLFFLSRILSCWRRDLNTCLP